MNANEASDEAESDKDDEGPGRFDPRDVLAVAGCLWLACSVYQQTGSMADALTAFAAGMDAWRQLRDGL